jgi:hypothetical protein
MQFTDESLEPISEISHVYGKSSDDSGDAETLERRRA